MVMGEQMSLSTDGRPLPRLRLARLSLLAVSALTGAAGLGFGYAALTAVAIAFTLVLAIAAQGRTVAIVEHNLKVVTELADHAYFMELGRITAEGTIDDLTNSPRLAAAYFGTV